MYVYKKEQQQDNNTKQTKRYDDVAAVRFYCILKSVKQKKKTIRKNATAKQGSPLPARRVRLGGSVVPPLQLNNKNAWKIPKVKNIFTSKQVCAILIDEPTNSHTHNHTHRYIHAYMNKRAKETTSCLLIGIIKRSRF